LGLRVRPRTWVLGAWRCGALRTGGEGQPDVEAELRKLEQSGRLRYERASEGYHSPPDR
jgi:hypothetical protein